MSIEGDAADPLSESRHSAGFLDQLNKSVDSIADKHLDRQVSLRLVVVESLNAYTSAWTEHRADEALDLRDPAVRADVSAFVHQCVESVGEPENPQFPVRRS